MNKLIKLSIAGGAVLLVPFFLLLWQAASLHQPASAVELMIPKGASTIKIGRMLQEQDVIGSKFTFRLATRLKGASTGLKSGLYRFEEPASINTIIDMDGSTQLRYYQVDLTLISLKDNRKVWLGQKKIKKIVKNSKLRF